jgi:tryptophan synthase alpha chain
MSRYARMFDRLHRERAGAFVPFVTLGDPSPADSPAVLAALCAGGADALELGIPFSDPVADGPTIQAAGVRALGAGMRTSGALALVVGVRREHPALPIGLLVYANIVEARGIDRFYAEAAAAGVDSVLVADVPTIEAEPYLVAARAHAVAPVMIATPNARQADLATIARMTEGYTYVASRAGVTGADRPGEIDLRTLIGALDALGAPPCLVGFGIARPEQVQAALRAGAAGAISGSAVVSIIERTGDDLDRCTAAITAFVRGMKAATF